jgi:hypothetical protein
MGPKCARTVPPLVPRQPTACSVCMGPWDTHISAPHARTIASHPTNVRRGMRSASRITAHNQEAQQATNTCTRERLQERRAHDPLSTVVCREPRRAQSSAQKTPWTKRAHQVLFGTADRDRAMILPTKSTKTAIRVDGEDVGGDGGSVARCSTHPLDGFHDPCRMSAPASTAPMNFSATSSASQPLSPRTPKQRRHGGQRDEDPSSQYAEAGSGLQTAFPGSCPIRLRPLVWILDREERQRVREAESARR